MNLDEGVRVINTLCEKIITLDDNFFPRVLIYPNTFIHDVRYCFAMAILVTIIK
jgi:hypothetical protein